MNFDAHTSLVLLADEFCRRDNPIGLQSGKSMYGHYYGIVDVRVQRLFQKSLRFLGLVSFSTRLTSANMESATYAEET